MDAKSLIPLLAALAACDEPPPPETYKGAELQYEFFDSGAPCAYYENRQCGYTLCLVDCEWTTVDWWCR